MFTVNGTSNWKHSNSHKSTGSQQYTRNKEKMGQAQSEEYHQDDGVRTIQNISDLELNSSNPSTHDHTGDSKRRGRKNQTSSSSLKSKQQQQQQQHQHVRKLSNVSNRNIQLLSMKPRGERDEYAENLRCRRRSSLINLILGAPSSGPRFSDDLYSLSSHISNFGIDFFPDVYRVNSATLSFSTNSVRLETSLEDCTTTATDTTSICNGNSKFCFEQTDASKEQQVDSDERRRRSSLGNLANITNSLINDSKTGQIVASLKGDLKQQQQQTQATRQSHFRKPSLTSTLASIDLTSSFEKYDKTGLPNQFCRPPLCRGKESIFEYQEKGPVRDELRAKAYAKARINQSGRVLRRTGSELSLYSYASNGSDRTSIRGNEKRSDKQQYNTSNNNYTDKLRETKLIIILQVCLPFIFAGFGNLAAGLVLHQVAQWRAFQSIPIFFILLPPFAGLKGNIEMTFASRMSTLSNLNLLDSKHQWRKLFLSNLILILSQAIGLTLFATLISTICQILIAGAELTSSSTYELLEDSLLVVLSSALVTAVVLILLASLIVSLSICAADLIQVNPDNLSTLVVALYGDVSCVLIYGLIGSWMFSLKELGLIVSPLTVILCSLISWPVLLFIAHKFKETRTITFSSIPPMIISILVSMGSGAILSMFVNRFKLIALFQPLVNGFGANLVAVQASRVSTWLWCSAIRDIPGIGESMKIPCCKTLGSLATFEEPTIPCMSPSAKKITAKGGKLGCLQRIFRKCLGIFWSFYNSSPNSVAARLLLLMLIPAQTLYFFIICFLTSSTFITITWQFYLTYISLCVIQVFILLAICEPLMSLLMKYHFDPDVFGISLLMALADLIGTLCLAGAFFFLSMIEDPNALS